MCVRIQTVVLATCVFLVLINISYQKETPTTTEPPIEDVCAKLADDCKSCVSNKQCLWCSTNTTAVKCVPYPVGQVIPHSSVCSLNDARWGVCWLNYRTMLICVGTLAGVIFLLITACCISCCCCRNKKKSRERYQREDAQVDREREQRRITQDEKRMERQSKYDDIRKKYGIRRNDNAYTRFENS